MMISVLEILILLVVFPAIFLIAAGVFFYVSRKSGSLLYILAGLAMTGLVVLIFLGLFYVRTESRSATLVHQHAVLGTEIEAARQAASHSHRDIPKKNDEVTEIPTDSFQKQDSVAQPLVAPKPVVAQPSRIVNDTEIRNASSKPADSVSTEMPDWVKEGLKTAVVHKHGLSGNSLTVVQSGLFATREEALQDALKKAMQLMKTELMLREPWLKHNQYELDLDLFRQTAYRRPYFQTVEHDFGDVLKSGESFKQDMFRAYVEIQNNPVVRERLLTHWKQNIGNERSFWVGGVFGLITLMCVGAAVYLRTESDQTTIPSSH